MSGPPPPGSLLRLASTTGLDRRLHLVTFDAIEGRGQNGLGGGIVAGISCSRSQSFGRTDHLRGLRGGDDNHRFLGLGQRRRGDRLGSGLRGRLGSNGLLSGLRGRSGHFVHEVSHGTGQIREEGDGAILGQIQTGLAIGGTNGQPGKCFRQGVDANLVNLVGSGVDHASQGLFGRTDGGDGLVNLLHHGLGLRASF